MGIKKRTNKSTLGLGFYTIFIPRLVKLLIALGLLYRRSGAVAKWLRQRSAKPIDDDAGEK